MIKEVKELLKFHDYVVIPNLGGFITNYEPAKLSLSTSTISSPSKKIAFNQSLIEDDGILINHLVSQKNWSLDKANKKLVEFTDDIHNSLAEKGVYELAGLGKLTSTNDGKIQFQPILKENYLLEAYGLERLVANTVEHEVVLEPVIEDTDVTIKTLVPVETVQRPWYFRAAAVIGLGFIMTTAGMSLFSGNVNGDQLSFVPINTNSKVIFGEQAVTTSNQLADLTAEDVYLYEEQHLEKIQMNAAIADKDNNFYVVIGSFLNAARMEKEIEKMQAKGYDVATMDGPKGYKRVALKFDTNQFNRYRTLHLIKATVNIDAWVLGA